jgi:hypothetical protein
MNNGLQELMSRISELRNEDILRMVYIDAAQYRPEAIAYAIAEIERRGIALNEIDSVTDSTPAYKDKPTGLGYRLLAIIRRKAFAIGFLGVLLFFVAANVYSYIEMPDEPRIADGFEECGFPFKLYMYGGFVSMPYILWDGLIVDILIAMVAGISIGLTCKLLFGAYGDRASV